jgi:hypothetical protein
MTVSRYYQTILDTLQGQTEELRRLPRERMDWTGSGAVLDLLHSTSGSDRTEMIRAIGQVIRKHPISPAAIAQLVNIASSLDLAEVEPELRGLQSTPFGDQEPLRGAIANYLAFRALTPALATPDTSKRVRVVKKKPTVRNAEATLRVNPPPPQDNQGGPKGKPVV